MTPLSTAENAPRKRWAADPWFIASVMAVAAVVLWLSCPGDPGADVVSLSRADGKPRFWESSYSKAQMPPHLTLYQRLYWSWDDYRRRNGKGNRRTYAFPASQRTLCSMSGLLNQCMEVTGTHYLTAVEACGCAVEFGHTNSLTGAQWGAAFEQAIATNGPVLCYDNVKKEGFSDTLLLIREKPGVVKIVPRSKLAEYRKAGLVRANP